MKNRDFAGAQPLKNFLVNNPTFDFRTSNIRRFIRDNSLDIDSDLKESLDTFQRVFSITPRFEKYSAMTPLLRDGFTSAYKITMKGKGNFKRLYEKEMGLEKTSQVYQAARQKVALTTSVFAAHSPYFNNIGIKRFYVGGDTQNPILDVTFDGVHIMDGDIVSPNTEIVMQLKDENQFLLLNDPKIFKKFGK